MTDPPSTTRSIPRLLGPMWDELSGAGERGIPNPHVLSHPYSDKGDPYVFGAVLAAQYVDGERWLVRGVLRARENRPPALVRVTIEHLEREDAEVTAIVLRSLNLAVIRDRALAYIRDLDDDTLRLFAKVGFVSVGGGAGSRARYEASANEATGGRRALSVDHYRAVAESYRAAVAAGRRDVVNALCEEWGQRLGQPVKRERVRQWLRRATELGFLPKGRPGVAGREQPKEAKDG